MADEVYLPEALRILGKRGDVGFDCEDAAQEVERLIAEVRRLTDEVKASQANEVQYGYNMDTAQRRIDALSDHSKMLNAIGWKIAQAIGAVPEGAFKVEDRDIGVDLDVLIHRATKPLTALMEAIYANNVAHGWFDEGRDFGWDGMLLTTEVAEMAEAYRDRGFERWLEDKGLPLLKPQGVGPEIADVIIRALDTAKRVEIATGDLDPDWEVSEKMAFNACRPIRHGGKRV